MKGLEVHQLAICRFGKTTDKPEGNLKELIGGKGAGLVEMANLGIPVPPGFTIPCEASVEYTEITSSKVMASYVAMLVEKIAEGDAYLQAEFGFRPLVSVRSGARVSMPGMMDTILNVGLTTENLPEWEKRIGVRAARDSFRRLIQMYGSVAMGIDSKKFEEILTYTKAKAGVQSDSDLSEADLTRLIGKYLELYKDELGIEFPVSREHQLRDAVLAVFDSWKNPRAEEYRKIHGIPFEWGTSATIQSMVFGNADDNSCTGVLFTRDPSTGEDNVVGEFLVNAQGEDVVAGIRTPLDLGKMHDVGLGTQLTQLIETAGKLEDHFRDMQDMEFTVQSGKLYLLQTRTGKRSALAAFKIAHDLCVDGMLSTEEALQRVTQAQLFSAMSDTIDPKFSTPPKLVGIAAGGGVVKGVAVFTSADAVNCTEPCILVTQETDPDDIAGMAKSVGILTATGGLTSHAAVVARGMNKSCVVGATDLSFSGGQACINGMYAFSKGTPIVIDGASGRVWVNTNVPVTQGGGTPEVLAMLAWSFDMQQVAQRIELRGDMTQDEIVKAVKLATANKVHVDMAALEYQSINFESAFLYLGGALVHHCEAEEIIIDCRPLASYFDDYDRALSKMFCALPEPESKAFGCLLKLPSSLVARTILVGLTSAQTKSAQAIGFKVGGVNVKTFADLAMAKGSVSVSQEVIESVFGGQEAFDMALSLIEKTSGKKPQAQKPPAYWYDTIKG